MRHYDQGTPDIFFPIAHTCFNGLELPNYSSKEVMKAKILWAIENTTSIDGDKIERVDIVCQRIIKKKIVC